MSDPKLSKQKQYSDPQSVRPGLGGASCENFVELLCEPFQHFKILIGAGQLSRRGIRQLFHEGEQMLERRERIVSLSSFGFLWGTMFDQVSYCLYSQALQ